MKYLAADLDAAPGAGPDFGTPEFGPYMDGYRTGPHHTPPQSPAHPLPPTQNHPHPPPTETYQRDGVDAGWAKALAGHVDCYDGPRSAMARPKQWTGPFAETKGTARAGSNCLTAPISTRRSNMPRMTPSFCRRQRICVEIRPVMGKSNRLHDNRTLPRRTRARAKAIEALARAENPDGCSVCSCATCATSRWPRTVSRKRSNRRLCTGLATDCLRRPPAGFCRRRGARPLTGFAAQRNFRPQGGGVRPAARARSACRRLRGTCLHTGRAAQTDLHLLPPGA